MSNMEKFVEYLRDHLPGQAFSDTEVLALSSGSPASRYGLVKRALANMEIIKLRRGVYCFGKRYQLAPLNLFELAQKIYAPSYVSLESALSYHGWIPEAAYTTTSVTPRRSYEVTTPAGIFSYARIPSANFSEVERVVIGQSIFLVAGPIKAVLDYVYVNKIEASPTDLFGSLRIDEGVLFKAAMDSVSPLANLYGSRRVLRFAGRWLRRI